MDDRRVGPLSSRTYEEIFSLSSQSLLIIDNSGAEPVIVHANPAFLARSGYSLEELRGMEWLTLIGLDEQSLQLSQLRQSLESRSAASMRLPYFHRDGELWAADLNLAPLNKAKGKVRLWLVQHDTEKRSATGDAHSSTKLLTRVQFEIHCRRELGAAKLEQKPMSLLMWSVPELDIYRETFGQKAADSCLRMIGTQVTGTFRYGNDMCALFDEATVAVAIAGLDESQAARRVELAEQKVRNLALHNPRGRRSRYLTIHGVAVQAEADESLDALFARSIDMLAAGAGQGAHSVILSA